MAQAAAPSGGKGAETVLRLVTSSAIKSAPWMCDTCMSSYADQLSCRKPHTSTWADPGTGGLHGATAKQAYCSNSQAHLMYSSMLKQALDWRQGLSLARAMLRQYQR